MTRAAAPHLKVDSSFVNVSSISGLSASAQTGVYNMTKFGLFRFSKAMALELGPSVIRTNVVCPDYVHTPKNMSGVKGKEAVEAAHKQVSLGKMAEPSETADAVAFLFSNEARYMDGSIVEVDSGIPRQNF